MPGQQTEGGGTGNEAVVVGLVLGGPQHEVLQLLVVSPLTQLVHVGVLAAVAVTHLHRHARVHVADVVLQDPVEGQAERHGGGGGGGGGGGEHSLRQSVF